VIAAGLATPIAFLGAVVLTWAGANESVFYALGVLLSGLVTMQGLAAGTGLPVMRGRARNAARKEAT
jgi:hypothetical protein